MQFKKWGVQNPGGEAEPVRSLEYCRKQAPRESSVRAIRCEAKNGAARCTWWPSWAASSPCPNRLLASTTLGQAQQEVTPALLARQADTRLACHTWAWALASEPTMQGGGFPVSVLETCKRKARQRAGSTWGPGGHNWAPAADRPQPWAVGEGPSA